MRYSTRFLIMLSLTLLLPAAANAQHYTYEGTITFLELSGKDCGEVKEGDSRPYTLAVGVQGTHITGYSLLQGADPGRFSGTGTENLSVEYPDPLQSTGHGISLLGLASTSLIGELRERRLRSDEAGCNLSRGQISARQRATSAAAEVQLRQLETDFNNAREADVAQKRAPAAYAEIQRLLPQASQVAAQQDSDPQQARALFDQLQPLFDQVYGAHSLPAYTNLSARAKFAERGGDLHGAFELRKLALQIASKSLPGQLALSNYNLADVMEKLGRKEEAAVFFIEAAAADEKQYGAQHPEVANDLLRAADVQEALGRNELALQKYERVLRIRQQTAGPDSSEAAAVMWKLAQLLGKMERQEQSLNWFRQELAITEKLRGDGHADTASSLEGTAGALSKLGRHREALPLLERALAIREKVYGEEYADTASSLRNLGWGYHNAGQDQLASQFAQRALAVDERVLGIAHRNTVNDLNDLALIYKSMGRFEEALSAQQRALAGYEKVYGAEHPDVAVGATNLADIYLVTGKYVQALPLYQRALAINEKVLGPDHVGTAVTLGNLALYNKTVGEYEQALALYQRALAIDEKALGAEHPATASDMNNLASLYVTLGRYAEASDLHQRALVVRERVLGSEHPETRISLNNLGTLHEMLGEYDKSLAYHARALSIAERSLGRDHPETAASLNNLATLYAEIGQFDKALSMAQRVVDIYQRSLGAQHALTATALGNQGVIYERKGDYRQALELAQRALSISEKALGDEHVDTAASLNNLATLYWRLGEHQQAVASYQRALAISEKKYGAEHAETAVVINNLAMVYGDMGRHDEALPLLNRALRIREHTLGDGHRYTGNTLGNLAFSQAALGRYTDALASFSRGNAIADKVIERVFAVANEKDKLAYVQQQEWGYFGQLSLIHQHFTHDPQALRQGLDLVLARKGIVFDAQARQNEALAGSLDPAARALWDELARQRAIQSRLLQNRPGELSAEAYQRQLRELDDRIDGLERQLAGRSALVAEQLKQRGITSAVLAGHLPAGAVLAEFIRIDDFDWQQGKWAGTQHYLAFLLHPDGHIDLADLGEASALESDLQYQLRQLDRIGLDTDLQLAATRKLYQMLWQPLRKSVDAADTVIFSPDGLLNLVPFAAMLGEDERFLIERRNVVYVTSGRELAKGDTGIKPDSLLYLAANPAFDLDSRLVPSDSHSANVTRAAGFDLQFGPLPGTQQEADYIPSVIRGKQRIVTGKQATEASVLAAGHPKIMHLATHGFFLSDQSRSGPGTRGAMALQDTAQATARTSSGHENPLVRSGLALAGANYAGKAQDGLDGLLTALEVSGMDLHGTDLVTLSACETGRGEVKSGEGVFGLRRAFALAGTAHLMMSLWPVSDDVTAQQMQRFYQLYGKKTNPAAALRQAQQATIAELRSKKGQAEPALWAPFIVQGW
ncbi:Photosystem I assembly protein Ycf3 [Ferriphaselus amnicola]|uniref:Photosystem I assembly protein Ycf3 n=2 Tax=Ferriphaselus amnicola TaxID=1188319 RepID=A0A2Z6GAL9_9PROT|nr:Photosystem I assembly protein Ycf3 [Ferriphaselus amnicola]